MIKIFKSSWLLYSVIFFLAFGIRAGCFYFRGVQPAGDSDYYLSGARILLDHHWSYISLAKEGYPFYYWFYPTFLAVFNGNQTLVVIVQILLESLAAVWLYQIATTVFNRSTGLLAAFIFIFWWEIFQWNTYILTDSLFIFVLTASLFTYLMAEKHYKYYYRGLTGLSILLAILLRPTSLPLLAAFYIVLVPFKKQWLKFGSLFIILIIISSLLTLIYKLAPHSTHGINYFIDYFIGLYQRGEIIQGRVGDRLSVRWDDGWSWHNVLSFVHLYILRLVAFWQPFDKQYAIAHKALNTLVYTPVYLGSAYAILNWKTIATNKKAFVFLTSLIIGYWLFQSLTIIDYDWRYRLPTLPFLVLLASGGIMYFWQNKSTFWKK